MVVREDKKNIRPRLCLNRNTESEDREKQEKETLERHEDRFTLPKSLRKEKTKIIAAHLRQVIDSLPVFDMISPIIPVS